MELYLWYYEKYFRYDSNWEIRDECMCLKYDLWENSFKNRSPNSYSEIIDDRKSQKQAKKMSLAMIKLKWGS